MVGYVYLRSQGVWIREWLDIPSNPKEWILNQANMRWQLTYKRSVGPVAKWIRECSPDSLKEWRRYYSKKLKGEKRVSAEEYLKSLGRKLHKKIKDVVLSEIESITEEDCIDFIGKLVIDRTYEGYEAEIHTIYEELQEELKTEIVPAPDEWNRRYHVDYYIKIGESYIGIQVKSAPRDVGMPEWVERWRRIMEDAQKKFKDEVGGKTFTVYSTEERKEIDNEEVIDEVKSEISRLKKEKAK